MLHIKLPASTLATYHCWVLENIEVLREWVAEFQSRALETVQG